MTIKKRLIDADYLVTMIARNAKLSVTAFSEISRIIRNIETVDAVEVVRWKDCIGYVWNEFDGCNVCIKHGQYGFRADDFCAYGERRTNERKTD